MDKPTVLRLLSLRQRSRLELCLQDLLVRRAWLYEDVLSFNTDIPAKLKHKVLDLLFYVLTHGPSSLDSASDSSEIRIFATSPQRVAPASKGVALSCSGKYSLGCEYGDEDRWATLYSDANACVEGSPDASALWWVGEMTQLPGGLAFALPEPSFLYLAVSDNPSASFTCMTLRAPLPPNTRQTCHGLTSTFLIGWQTHIQADEKLEGMPWTRPKCWVRSALQEELHRCLSTKVESEDTCNRLSQHVGSKVETTIVEHHVLQAVDQNCEYHQASKPLLESGTTSNVGLRPIRFWTNSMVWPLKIGMGVRCGILVRSARVDADVLLLDSLNGLDRIQTPGHSTRFVPPQWSSKHPPVHKK